jgi:hypothetical protein
VGLIEFIEFNDHIGVPLQWRVLVRSESADL